MEKADDDLRPVIPLVEEALVPWVLGASCSRHHQYFWSARTRGMRGL